MIGKHILLIEEKEKRKGGALIFFFFHFIHYFKTYHAQFLPSRFTRPKPLTEASAP